MSPDFPAAHSMDTDWFAVDRDGRVALFDSSENGALAEGAARLDAPIAFEDLAPHAAGSEALYLADDLYRQVRPGHEHEHLFEGERIVVFVRSLDVVADAIAAGLATALPSAKRPATLWSWRAREAVARLHQDGLCRRCHALRVIASDDDRRPGDLGLYLYEHAPDVNPPGPYARVERPSRPLHLDALPAPLREKLSAVRFTEVSFEDDALVQPFEHVPSHAYGAGVAWRDVTGEVHAVPGLEADFAYAYEGAPPPEIRFYGVGEAYGVFSNFHPAPIRLKGKVWPTTEHYFQAQKFAGTKHEVEILAAKTPAVAARKGRERSRPLRRDWEAVKDSVMRDAVRAKFEQHDELRRALLDTGEARLVEHTESDAYWGDGGDGSGRNRLGEILMELRATLRDRPGGGA